MATSSERTENGRFFFATFAVPRTDIEIVFMSLLLWLCEIKFGDIFFLLGSFGGTKTASSFHLWKQKFCEYFSQDLQKTILIFLRLSRSQQVNLNKLLGFS